MEKKTNNELGELIRLAMGNRTFREYAKDAGVSPASINRIIKGDYIPSPKALRKLTSIHAQPKNGVTYEDLMVAAGYQTSLPDYLGITDGGQPILIEIDSNKSNNKREKQLLNNQRKIETENFVRLGISIIQRELIQNGFIYEADYPAFNKPNMADFTIYLDKKDIKEWCFDFKKYSHFNSNYHIQRILQTDLGRVTLYPPNSTRKLSIVTDRSEIFENFARYENKISYKGDLSIILIDMEKFCVEKEVYLSAYNDSGNTIFYIK